MESPTHLADCAQIAKAYQKALFSSADEETVYSSLLPKLASARSTATSSSALLTNITNPPIPPEIGSLISNPVEVAQSVGNAALGAATELIDPNNWMEVLEKCIPCSSRISLRLELLDQIPLSFMLDLEKLLDQLLGQLDAMIKILNSGGVYNDSCTLYKFFTEFVCIPDLQRIVALLGAILYRMSVNLTLSIDVIKSLVQPIFLPIFVNVTNLLNQFVAVIVNPLDCIVAAIDLQLEKIDINKGLTREQVQAVSDAFTQPGITGIQNQTSLQQDLGVDDLQHALFSSMAELKKFMFQGQRDLRATLEQYLGEINKFITDVHGDTNYFDLQMEKLKIVRLINFIGAVIGVLVKGFECSSPPKATTEEFAAFLQEFLSPARDITFTLDANGNTKLVLNTDVSEAVREITSQVLVPTGNSTIDKTINKIVDRVTTPVVLKPQCLFTAESNTKVSEWISELNRTEV